MSFSERMGFVPERKIQIESMDDRLQNRLYNFCIELINDRKIDAISMINCIIDYIGMRVDDDYDINYSIIQQTLSDKSKWYHSYDIIEHALDYYKKNNYNYDDSVYLCYVQELNDTLQEEKSGYRMIDGQFVPITDENELKEIQDAMHSEFDSVDQHIKKALTLYSDRDKPDYENSIKESISAVEAMCCIITGMKGKNATLGEALKKLEENGVHIHGAMKSGFSSLYGYASDENGIRHGGIDFVNAPEEDARYMLVSCSAFVNYLKDKYSKTQNGGQ